MPKQDHWLWITINSKIYNRSNLVKVAQKSDSPMDLFAVKEFRSQRALESQKDYIKRITSEFTIGSCLNHPNIIKTIDLIQTNDQWCIVLEYLSGGDMMTFLLDHTLSSSETFFYFSQLLNGVRYLHQMGIAHKDLKPENCKLLEIQQSIIECIKDYS